jgi:hypothetical protein
MIEYQQNKRTDSGDFIISHSDLCKLDPALGGHPKLFYKALSEPQEQKDKPSFERGDMLHLWMQNRDSFVIEELSKPTEKPAELAEAFYHSYIKEGWKSDPIFLEIATRNTTIDVPENLKLKELFKVINRREPSEQDFAIFVANVRYARTVAEYNKTLKELTFLDHFERVIPYLQFLEKANGKTILTVSMRDILSNCVDSMREHPFASTLVWGMDGEVEKEYFWQRMVRGITINRKAKVDKVMVDAPNKTLIITDYKTTAYPVANFDKPDGAYYKYALGRQLLSYKDAFFACNTSIYSGDWKVQLYNIVVGTIDPYPVMVYATPSLRFSSELVQLEERAAFHIQNNQWKITLEEAQNKGKEYITII